MLARTIIGARMVPLCKRSQAWRKKKIVPRRFLIAVPKWDNGTEGGPSELGREPSEFGYNTNTAMNR
jgi:hypothetical protein